MRILIAGFGNSLRGDDGFGVELLERLRDSTDSLPGIGLLEAGIGGISLVQELLGGYDGLIVLDAVEGDEPGQVRVLELEVGDPRERPALAVREYFADVHYAEPGRALALAKGIDLLPAAAFLVGCVPRSCELGEGLTTEVEAALEPAVRLTLDLVDAMRRDHAETP